MTRRGQNKDDWDDQEEDDWDANANYEDFGSDDEEVEPTIACPYCQAEIHEESLRCPFCENYISRDDSPPQRRPLWLVVGIVICLILVLLWIIP